MWTSNEEIRIQKIEKAINALQLAITKAVTLDQLKQMITLRQQEIKALTDRVNSLESQILVLQK